MSSAGISRLWALPEKRYEILVLDKKDGRLSRIDLNSPSIADEYVENARTSGCDVDVFDHGELFSLTPGKDWAEEDIPSVGRFGKTSTIFGDAVT